MKSGDALRHTIPVEAGAGTADYPVHVGPGILDELPGVLEDRVSAHRYAVIGDETVERLHGEKVVAMLLEAGLRVDSFTFAPGEASKTREQWARLTDELLEAGVGRDGAVVALGGGVTGDLAGFVAATFMRGVPVVQVPSSLVAMIDASVGGKTGVDVSGGKNLVGAFHPPRAVVADPEVIQTLPRDQRSQGLAEAVKHGAILDRAYLDALSESAASLLAAEPASLVRAVVRSVELKAGVVSRDEREGGVRTILNFGHTLGHAVEAAAGYTVPHGSAISVGMVLEARVGERLGITEEGTSGALAEILGRFDLPTELPAGLDSGAVVGFTHSDKKGRRGEARYVLLTRLGEVAPGTDWSHAVDPSLIREVLQKAASKDETARATEA